MEYSKLIQRRAYPYINYNIRTKLSFDPTKEKEIIVWLRLQKDMDKQQLIDFMREKFNVAEIDAELIFEKEFPEGIEIDWDLKKVDDLAVLEKSISKQKVSAITDVCLGLLPEDELDNIDMPNTIKREIVSIIGTYLRRKV